MKKRGNAAPARAEAAGSAGVNINLQPGPVGQEAVRSNAGVPVLGKIDAGDCSGLQAEPLDGDGGMGRVEG